MEWGCGFQGAGRAQQLRPPGGGGRKRGFSAALERDEHGGPERGTAHGLTALCRELPGMETALHLNRTETKRGSPGDSMRFHLSFANLCPAIPVPELLAGKPEREELSKKKKKKVEKNQFILFQSDKCILK